jgi:hypothetical protein
VTDEAPYPVTCEPISQHRIVVFACRNEVEGSRASARVERREGQVSDWPRVAMAGQRHNFGRFCDRWSVHAWMDFSSDDVFVEEQRKLTK